MYHGEHLYHEIECIINIYKQSEVNPMNKMNRYQQELCMNLTQLLTEDYTLLNDVIKEYVTLLGNTNRMHDLHEFTCKEIENDWGRG